MATRSTIALEFADGTVQQVYCHWDGYLEHNGQILRDHYSNPFVLRDLIDLGAISSLGPKIGTKHPFSKFEIDSQNPDFDKLIAQVKLADEQGFTTFYARDRGEELVKHTYKDYADYVKNAQREEYNYILRNVNGQATWFVEYYACDGGWLTLEEAFELKDEVDA